MLTAPEQVHYLTECVLMCGLGHQLAGTTPVQYGPKGVRMFLNGAGADVQAKRGTLAGLAET